jgi:hypothetical protein
MESSFLAVKGGPKSSDPTTGIIVIAVICCVVGTSLGKSGLEGVFLFCLFVSVWVFIIYQTRRRASKRDWEVEGETLQTPTTGLPLLGDPELKERNGK